MSLAIVLATLNRSKHLKKCIDSILDQKIDLQLHLIIVDQSSDELTKNLITEYEHNIKSVKWTYFYQKEKSLTLARNNGIRNAHEETYICFLDDDLVLYPNFFNTLLSHLNTSHYAGGMGTFDHFPYRNELFRKFFLMPHLGNGNFLINGMPTFPHWKNSFTEVEFLSGGITMYKRDVLLKNLFDEKMFGYGYGDDVDVSFRVSRQHKLFYEPSAKVHHDDHSSGRDPGFVHRKNWIQNMFYLLRKNQSLSLIKTLSFFWMVLGFIIDDFIHLRKGAFLGNFKAISNILLRKIDSVYE